MEAILASNPKLRHEDLVKRYDMVLHLVTAANGAEKYYTLENNAARSEGVELAIDIDDTLQERYSGARNHL